LNTFNNKFTMIENKLNNAFSEMKKLKD